MNYSSKNNCNHLIHLSKCVGFSLVELMVSMAISFVLLLAITNVYLGSKETYRVREDFSKLQELGRQGLEVLTRSILMTDHWGGVPSSDITVGTVTGITAGSGACDAAWIQNTNQPLIGEDGVSAVSGLTQFQNCVATNEYVPNSDVLIIRYADSQPVIDSVVNASSGLFIRSEVESRGQLFVGSSGTSGTGVGTSSTLNATRNYQYRVEAYFLRNCSDVPCTDGIPTLSRLTMIDNALQLELIADGVEQIQYQYGLDTDGDAVADQFVNAGNVVNWNQVVAVNIDAIIRSANQDHSVSDTATYSLAGGSSVAGGINFTPASSVQTHHRKQLSKLIHVRNRVRS